MFQRSAVVDISLVLPKRTRTYAYLICYAGSKLEAHMLVHLPSLMSDTKRHLYVPKLTWMAVALNYAMRLMAWPKAVFPLRGSMPSCSCDAPPASDQSVPGRPSRTRDPQATWAMQISNLAWQNTHHKSTKLKPQKRDFAVFGKPKPGIFFMVFGPAAGASCL